MSEKPNATTSQPIGTTESREDFLKRVIAAWETIKREQPGYYEQLIREQEQIAGGKWKRVFSLETGKTYAVPVEVIVTSGLTGLELVHCDEWDDEVHGSS